MSLRRKVFAAAAMLALVGGVSVVGSPPASAATPECGNRCIEIFSRLFGTSEHPNVVETVYRGLARVGQPLILARASGSNPAQDLLPSTAGLVSDFYRAGLVSAEVNRHYGALRATQVEYAPFGVASGLCVGVAIAYQNEGLTLQRCGISARTVWIVDTADSPATAPEGFFPLVNGSTTDFCHPLAMTYPRGAHRLGGRHAQIRVRHLINNPADVPDRQLWGTAVGVLT
jgi:hypothetical protein